MKISESGRSMVEMLGVLAIMGVLTVGVMLGYRYAMDRILTNSIITGVRARSVIIGQQRVLGQPLNLSEFHPDTEKDLIYGRFEVKAFNNYVYDGEESQAMEVHNIPRRVCENIRMLTFPDETVTLVNGSEMGECITDGERENTGGLHDGGDYFTAEYHNVVTFVFDEPLKSPCETDSECLPCRQCNDGYCEAKEEAEGKVCSYGACCKAGLCDPNGCECPPDERRPESGCWIERFTEFQDPCPGHRTYEPCACPEGWSTTEEPCAGTVNTQTVSGDIGPALTCYQCQECPKGNTCPNGACCTETEHAATDDCPAYKTYTPATCECSAGFSKTPCGGGQMTKETETLKDGTVCYQCQECPTSNECLPGTCCKEETMPADDSTGCPAYTKYTPTDCKCSEGFSKTPCGDGQTTKETETLRDGTVCYQCQECPTSACPDGQCCKEETVPADDSTGCPAYTKYTPTTCKCSEGTSATCENGQVRTELKETLGDGARCYTCGGCKTYWQASACTWREQYELATETISDIEDSSKKIVCRFCASCPTSECPNGQCCTEETVPANSTTGCPAYTKYTPATCECSPGFSKTQCGYNQNKVATETLKDGTVCYKCQACYSLYYMGRFTGCCRSDRLLPTGGFPSVAGGRFYGQIEGSGTTYACCAEGDNLLLRNANRCCPPENTIWSYEHESGCDTCCSNGTYEKNGEKKCR